MIIKTADEFRIALDNASSGDVIRLAGVYFVGVFSVEQESLTICSADANDPACIEDNRPSQLRHENFTLTINSPNVTLRNLRFKTPNSITIRINASDTRLENLLFQYVKIAFICSSPNLTFKNIKIRHFTEDGIRLSSDNFKGENVLIEDLHAAKRDAHHDGIQLYAGKPNTPLRHAGRYEGKYALNKGTLKNVVIRSTTDNNRADIGQLQGIFSSDGFMDGIQLDNIQVITHNCIHGVSLRGIRTAQDGTTSQLNNVSVIKTPGMSGLPPQIRFVPARRLTSTAVKRERIAFTKSITEENHSYIHLNEDESNLSEILFPPQRFRNFNEQENTKAYSKSITLSDWECIPQGSYDQQQQRTINYQVTLENNNAQAFEDFSCNNNTSAIPHDIQGESNMDRAKFYTCIRNKPFNGRLMQHQVNSMEAMLNEWDKRGEKDTRYLAYILATAYHETAHTMQPIEEYGKGRGRRYCCTYYGRGFVQITWKSNYKKFSKRLDVDLVNHPEKALEPEIATQIIFDGMLKGLFTGKKLAHYFKGTSDWYNARRIVNGLDRADKIGRYGRQFWFAILMAQGEIRKANAVPKSIQPIEQEVEAPEGEVSELMELEREFG